MHVPVDLPMQLELSMLQDLEAPPGRPFTHDQAAAIARREGSLLLSANAGSGKTSVLVERFVRSMLEDGIAADAMLAITFTDKAAGELRQRIRGRLIELGAREGARDAEAAWISTIHGFCARVLRAHAVIAGLDPSFVVLDEPSARALRAEAFDRALAGFLEEGADGRPRAEALDLAAAWTPDRLRDAVLAVHDELRSRGQTCPRLPPPPPVPALGPLRDALVPAAAAAEADLATAAPNRAVELAQEALAACRDGLTGHPEDAPPPAGVLAAARFAPGNARALQSDACRGYLEAHAAYAAACRDHAAVPVHALLDEMLRRYGHEYAEAKTRASALDYDDLELGARDLFVRRPAIARGYAERFVRVMVDEFQDTNPLQLEILDLLARDNLFLVGDELQSIYGFRHADVGGFRRRREELPAAELTTNWRAHPEILETLNAGFGAVHESYSPLRPGRGDPPAAEPRVELLLTDTAAWDEEAAGLPKAQSPSRQAEARAVARRIRRLVDAEGVAAGDVALLLRATTDMGLYERALELEGLPTLATGGRGFWARQQVQDLLAYLGALANPRDEAALWTLLASPIVGLTSDALALMAVHAAERGVAAWDALTGAFCAGEAGAGLVSRLPAADRVRLEAFCPSFATERELAPRLRLDVLLERVIDSTGYDLHVLALPGGRRRLANVHKLLRLAAAFEDRRGRDVRGFIDHALAELEADAREPEAPVELAGLNAVRLMTIHAAKGLEFPVVVLADLGRRGNASVPDLLVDGDLVGLRLVMLDGHSEGAFAHDRLKERAQAAQAAEERRVIHVALTRAQERLILSGAVCLAKPWPTNGAAAAPLAWLGPALAEAPAGLLPECTDVQDLDEPRPGGRLRLRIRRNACREAIGPTESRPEGSSEVARAGAAGAADAGEEAGDVTSPPRLPIASLSYSALASYGACGYRFYLERLLRLPPDEQDAALLRGTATGLDARLRGTLAHELLQALDFTSAAPPAPEEVRACALRHGAELSDEETSDLCDLVGAFAASDLCRRLAGCQDVRREQEFCFALEGGRAGSAPLLTGVVDVRAREGDVALVVDYKSDRVTPEADLVALAERDYGAQRRIYALAELRAGAREVEVVHVYLHRPGDIVAVRFAQADSARLEADLHELIAGISEGRFPVAAEPHRGLCLGCPGRRALCSYEEAATLRELAVTDSA